MTDYNNQPCAGCGKHFHEGNDIVVCPVCATPQHRECWQTEGHCVNESLHSPDFVWKPRESVQLDDTAESNKKCHICGAENLSDALHCGNCGALLSGESEENSAKEKECRFCGEINPASNRLCSKCGAPLLFENNFFQDNIYMRGVDAPEDEALGSTTVGNAAYFIQNSAKRYIPKFRRIASGGKISFNWAAFLFAPWWFFFRKLYKAGAIILVLMTSITLMTYNYQSQVAEVSQTMAGRFAEIQEQYKDVTDEKLLDEATEKLNAVYTEFVSQVKKPLAVIAAVTFFEHLICGFIANLIYYKRMNQIIDKVKEANAPDEIKKSLIIRAGGVSFISLAAGFFGGELLTSVISYAADLIIRSM